MIKGVVAAIIVAVVVIPKIAYCTGETCILMLLTLKSVSTLSCRFFFRVNVLRKVFYARCHYSDC